MQLTHYKPNFFSRPSSLIASFLGENPFETLWNTGRQSLPAINLREQDDAYTIQIAAPGLDKKDFSLAVDDGLLTISYKKEQHEKKEEKEGEALLHEEFSYLQWERHVQLPKESIEAEKINASYKDGLLSVHVPKRKEAQRSFKTISIN